MNNKLKFILNIVKEHYMYYCKFIYSQSFCQKSAERKSENKYF